VSPFLRDAPPATAAVLVRLRAGAELGPEQVATIQTLVAAGVPRLRRDEVKVLDPRGRVLGGALEPEASPRLAIERDLARRALAVLTPWLGERVSVQVTATLDDSETRQTVERVRSVGVGGQARPLERTVRTTVQPEGRLQRVSAIVIVGFDASADELRRVEQMARQALGLQRPRGDSLSVFALPAATAATRRPEPVAQSTPAAIPQVRPVEPTPPPRDDLPLAALAAAAVLALLLAAAARRFRRRRPPEAAPPAEDFDADLHAVRSRVLADPRVAADVVRLWMRA
jgi:flagellar M-ring protein FliF